MKRTVVTILSCLILFFSNGVYTFGIHDCMQGSTAISTDNNCSSVPEISTKDCSDAFDCCVEQEVVVDFGEEYTLIQSFQSTKEMVKIVPPQIFKWNLILKEDSDYFLQFSSSLEDYFSLPLSKKRIQSVFCNFLFYS